MATTTRHIYTTQHFRDSARREFERLWHADKSGAGRSFDRGLNWLALYFNEPTRLLAPLEVLDAMADDDFNAQMAAAFTPERFAAAAYDAALSATWND